MPKIFGFLLGGGGGGATLGNFFTTFTPDFGDNVVATTFDDTITWTSSDGFLEITGDAGFKTMDLTAGAGSILVSSVFGRTGIITAQTNDYTWAQIDKTVSDIADINLKSHTSLTAIGTNTHPQIDDHIADVTTNPHDVTAAQAGAVALTGDESVAGIKTFTSIPVLPASNPTTDNQAVRKLYVDTLLTTGARFVGAVNAATTAALAASTYNNGASGAGATLTADANGAFATIDGVAAALNNVYLIKDQADGFENGAYLLTQLGDGGTPWILTRITTYDVSAEIVGGTFFNVLEGTTHARQQWALLTTGTITVGTTNLVYGLLSEAPEYTASNGVLLSGNDFQIDLSDTNPSLEVSDGGLRAKVDGTTITRNAGGLAVGTITDANVSGAIDFDHGGTNLTAIGTANQVLGVDNGATGLEYKSVVGGSNVTVVHTANEIEINSSLTGAPDFIYTQHDMVSDPTNGFAVTNMAAAVTTLSTNTRIRVDLTGATQYRIGVTQSTAGFSTAFLRLRYSVNNVTFLDIGDESNIGDLAVGAGTGVKVGSWENLVGEAKADVWLQLYSYGGDGIVDPNFRQIWIEVERNSSIVDGSTSSVISNQVTFHSHPSSSVTWTNMPAAVTEFPGATTARFKVDLSGVEQFRIVVYQQVAGFAGADFNLQYSLNNSTFQAADTGAAGELDVGTGTGVKVGAWASLVDAARQDVWLRLVGKQGDGVVDPQWRQVAVQFRGSVFAPTAGSDTYVIYNELGTASGSGNFTFNYSTNVLSVPTISLTNATQNMNLTATDGILSVQSQDSGEQCAYGIFSKDGDGTDNIYHVYFAKGLPGSIGNNESLLVGYVASSTEFQIAASAEGTGTVRPINIYTEGNYNQLEIQTDGTLGLNGKINLETTTIGAGPAADVNLVKSTTTGNSTYFGVATPTGDGTEETGFAIVGKGVTPQTTNSKVSVWNYDFGADTFQIFSIGNGTEVAPDLKIGITDTPSLNVNQLTMNKEGDFNLNDFFFANNLTGKAAIGVSDPTSFDIGAAIRPALTIVGYAATIGGDIGFPLRFEAHEDEGSANALVGTLSGGTRASPTIVTTGTEVLSIYTAAYDGVDYLLAGQLSWGVTGTPGVGNIKTQLILAVAESTGLTIDDNADVVINRNLVSINSVDYDFPASGSQGYFYRASDGTVTFDNLSNPVQNVQTISLTSQGASIGSTGFTGTSSAAGLYKINFYVNIPTEDAGAGNVELQFSWNDGVGSKATTSYVTAMNDDQNYTSGSLVLYKGASQTVAYNTVVTGTPGTATYNLYMTIEKL